MIDAFNSISRYLENDLLLVDNIYFGQMVHGIIPAKSLLHHCLFEIAIYLFTAMIHRRDRRSAFEPNSSLNVWSTAEGEVGTIQFVSVLFSLLRGSSNKERELFVIT